MINYSVTRETPGVLSKMASRAELVEVNEKLVIAALRSQADVEVSTQALKELSRHAELDVLTELPNRSLLLDRFARAVAMARRRKIRLALLFLDLNDFKKINDTYGHAIGDQMLKQVALCLTQSVRGVDTVSRHGGDEFLILLTEIARPSDAATVAKKILAALATPYRVADVELNLMASIGISIYPDDGEDVLALIEHADTAMYRAKQQAMGGFFFHGEHLERGQSVEVAPPVPPQLRGDCRGDECNLVSSEYAARLIQLRDANEQLVIVALNSQDLRLAAERTNRQQMQYQAVLAHELRNPLAPIRMAAALLTHASNDLSLLPKIQTIIERQMVHLTRLVGDLLDVSLINAGKLRLQLQLVEMSEIIHAAVDSVEAKTTERRQNLSVKLPDCALAVYGDPVRLTQVVSNLLDNACKYTHEGGDISLLVEVLDRSLIMTVSDTGIGITVAALAHVFDAFVQEPHATSFNGEGMGIGLTVVRELVEAHAGTVVAHSEGSGLGTRFVVVLPLSSASLAA